MISTRCLAAAVALAAFPTAQAQAQAQEKPTLYVVPYAHLDTQWRWSYPQVIREYLWNTMEDNFRLFDRYPGYTFNFGGSRRFEMMKEYFPGEYAKVVAAVRAGRWFPAPASVDETECNIISGESVIRNVLYGNRFYAREFGVTSEEFMRPDSFGFPYSLPTLLVHAGLKGFSTQKLTWGSPVGIPFNVGMWVGPDGSEIASALNPTSYGSTVDGDLSHDAEWIARLAKDPIPVDYRYYGTGDRGGAPAESSVRNGEASVKGDGPIRVVQTGADAMFKALTPAQKAKLPRYRGELLLTQHSAGSMSSHSEMKRWNRMNELLASAAERASVAATVWTGAPYPADRLDRAWDLTLGSQMHDMLPGTCLPKAYEYAQNDELLAMNDFAHVETDAVGRVTARMDTRAKGTALVVRNPLSVDREDVVEAWVPRTQAPEIVVTGPDGKRIQAQILGDDRTERGGAPKTRIAFLAKVPANGFASYDVEQGVHLDVPRKSGGFGLPDAGHPFAWANGRVLENGRFKVTIDAAGDIASLYDKRARKECLKSPARLDLQYENPNEWPAWNMDWKDQSAPPRGHVDGPAAIRVVERGPVRATIEVTREAAGSRFTQRISLAAGDAGDHVEVANKIDWGTRETALKAAFHLADANPKATYGMQVGAIERGNNNEKAYEVPVHGWMDLSSPDGKSGVGILTPFKFGADKPSDDTLRLTLIYTPGTHGGYQDQGVQDFGRHDIVYGIAPHAGDWRQGKVAWQSARLAQPLRAFVVGKHDGLLGKAPSLLDVSTDQVEAMAIKRAEDGDGLIVRLRELTGKPATNVRLTMANGIRSAEAVDGQERPLGKATLKGGALVASVRGYGLASYRIRPNGTGLAAPQPASQTIDLPYDLDVVSTSKDDKDGAFDGAGRSYAAEALPKTLTLNGVGFRLGPTADGAKNALQARGQTIRVPAGYDRVYVLSAATVDTTPTFKVGSREIRADVPAWSGYVGGWDLRLWDGVQPELAYGWQLPFAGLAPGFVKQAEVAWYASHDHVPGKGNGYYEYTYLFKQGFDVPKGATTLTLPNDPRVAVFAVSVAKGTSDAAAPAVPLYDTLADHVPGGAPRIAVPSGGADEGVDVTIRPPLYGSVADVRYTTDGSTPTAVSARVAGPIYVGRPTVVKAALIQADGTLGPVAEARVTANDATAPRVTALSLVRSLGVATLRFSEPVDRTVASKAESYAATGAKVTAAAVAGDARSVTLTLDGPVSTEASFAVTVTARDRVGNEATAVAGNPTDASPLFTAPPLAPSKTARFDAPVPKEGKAPWTLNLWVKVDRQPENRTIVAGFGRARDGESGTGRYIAKFGTGIQFWSANEDVPTRTPLDLGRWQMITATYDGTTVRLYKDGKPIGQGPADLRDDVPRVNVLPPDAWEGKRRVDGEVRDLTVWGTALPPTAIERLYAQNAK